MAQSIAITADGVSEMAYDAPAVSLPSMEPSRRVLVLAMLCLAPVLGLVACDPCSGVASCSRGDYLAAAGQIVDVETGRGVDGVRLDLVRTDGLQLDADSISAVTSDGGFWRAEFSPTAPGDLDVDVEVSPPGEEPYRLHGIRLSTRSHGGDANLNERWVTRLYFNYMGELYLNGTEDQRIANAPVEFRRTRGVSIYGPGQDAGVHRAGTDFAGRVNLFPALKSGGVFAREEAALIGDLTVQLPSGLGTAVLRGVALVPTHLYRQPSIIARAPVGP